MSDEAFVIRLATPDDIAQIEQLDKFGTSPTRNIHRDMEKYFGSVDPSTHEHTFIFLLEIDGHTVAKAELMVPPGDVTSATGYVKRVVSHPDHRGKGLAKQLLQHIITFARNELKLTAIDLHVWDQNVSAIRLYESLGFNLQHRELYYRLPL
ncbi:MAG TPA: N-acetyltransferase [Ktedonobacteraceae bacterium]|nr:N-acetyltransferase [Ktedonobacteraceae bacterium]